jgi:hypothetical protein
VTKLTLEVYLYIIKNNKSVFYPNKKNEFITSVGTILKRINPGYIKA